MPCPVCIKPIDATSDHRRCVFHLLEQGTIQSVEEWEALSMKPLTIRKGRRRALIPKEML
jgi:hypothetical protein